MIHLVGGLILAALSAYFWFVLPKEADEESARGLVLMVKSVLGTKGYITLAKVLAVFMAFSSASEFYQFIIGLLN